MPLGKYVTRFWLFDDPDYQRVYDALMWAWIRAELPTLPPVDSEDC